MKLFKLIVFVLILISSFKGFSQKDTEQDSHTLRINLNLVAQLNIQSTNSKSISLNAEAPTEAGAKVTFNQTNNDLWLNYSSIVAGDLFRNVTAQITEGNVPAGVNLSVTANEYIGEGEGDLGDPIGNKVVLNKNQKIIIEGIGNAYTGYGVYKGHNLVYKIEQKTGVNAYKKLKSSNTTLTITYTLTDN